MSQKVWMIILTCASPFWMQLKVKNKDAKQWQPWVLLCTQWASRVQQEEENTEIESRAKRERSIILVNISHVATSRELKRTLLLWSWCSAMSAYRLEAALGKVSRVETSQYFSTKLINCNITPNLSATGCCCGVEQVCLFRVKLLKYASVNC